jgi:hypothetical protein
LIWFLLFKIRSEEDRRKIADYRIQIRLKEKRKKTRGEQRSHAHYTQEVSQSDRGSPGSTPADRGIDLIPASPPGRSFRSSSFVKKKKNEIARTANWAWARIVARALVVSRPDSQLGRPIVAQRASRLDRQGPARPLDRWKIFWFAQEFAGAGQIRSLPSKKKERRSPWIDPACTCAWRPLEAARVSGAHAASQRGPAQLLERLARPRLGGLGRQTPDSLCGQARCLLCSLFCFSVLCRRRP